ncbi:insulin-like growth factor-binding protein complex acid labile subunit [Patiria miniata]|uniref:Ig-like domain-containing protein n=1 Tax=Patiria miniata TaxID=46514 RepID=A0A914AU22_PATMI|nr:insulin-like growth factor-binding protein complex acid labile subunit [Patiria miniata]
MAMFIFLLCIGAFIRMSESSTCHAQCDYDHVTARADCSSRNLTCIPVNYPDSLIMDLSHNAISMLEPGGFNGTFTRLVELYLDNNAISDVTSLLQSTGLGSLKKLSMDHNIVNDLPYSCSLSALEEMSLDYNSLSDLRRIPSCNSIKRFSANSNEIQSVHLPRYVRIFPSFISLRFNRIGEFFWYLRRRGMITPNVTFLLDHNEITNVEIRIDDYFPMGLGLLSLSHNGLQHIKTPLPTKFIIASNGLREFSGFNFFQREETLLEELDIRNNSFDSLIQPEWAEGLQILYADDNILANLSSTTLQGFGSLTELHLANNRLMFISSTALSQLTKLRSLYLDGNALTSLFGEIFLKQGELVELSIANNQLHQLYPDYFLGLNSLERLYLAGNRLVYVQPEMFRQMPGLTTMDFSKNELEVFDITNCSLLKNVTNLLLAHNSIHAASYILGHCNNLIVLDLSFNQIKMVPGDSLTEGNRALSKLELEGNPLYCDCRLKGLRDWLRNNPPSVLPRCHGPSQYSEAVVTDLDKQYFICDPPKAVTDVNPLNVIVGQTAILSCTATGIPISFITWLDPNGTVIPDESQGRFIISIKMNLHIISVKLSDQGMYACLVQNILGEMDRAVVNLTVTEDQIPPLMTKVGPSLAAVVLPTMFITIVFMLLVFVLVICLRRRYKKRHHQTSSATPGPQNSELAVTFQQGKASNSDGVYVNEVADQEGSTAIQRAGSNDEYQDTIRTDEPPQVYQELRMENKDDFYEPVASSRR